MHLHKDNLRQNYGVSLIEVLISIAILAIIGFLSVASFNNMSNKDSLDKSSEMIVSMLSEARSKAISSKSMSDFGIHFDQDRVIRFKGNVYTQNDPENVTYNLSNRIEIVSPNPTNIVFARLSGETENIGTTTLRLKSDHSQIKDIQIYRTGVSNILN